MPKLFPFKGYTPAPDLTQTVIAPPYDVVSREEVKLQGRDPHSLLRVTRPEAALSDAIAFNDPRVYEQAKQAWQTLLSDSVMQAAQTPCYYVYEMRTPEHTQVGVMALVDIHDCESNVVRRHELTRPDKEDDRRNHILAVNGQLSPVLLTTQDDGEIEQFLRVHTQRVPSLTAKLDRVTHSVWFLSDTLLQKQLQALFEREPLFYIADGHHRTAAALRAFKEAPEGHPARQHPYCLAAIFPAQQLKIQGYHRLVQDLNGQSEADFLEALKMHYDITPLNALSLPNKAGVTHMQLGAKAYALKRQTTETRDPIAQLDVDYLARHVLTPLLAIEDVRTNPRISFVGGAESVERIQAAIASGEAAVGFVMYPTQMHELIQVANAEQLMPPKSTWFEPKVADGLVCYSFTPT